MIHISLIAEKIFQYGSFAITNSMLTGLLGSFLIIVLFGFSVQAIKSNPKSLLAQGAETVIESLMNLIEQVTQDQRKAGQFFPLLATFFLFILVNNWIGLLPGVGTILIHTQEGLVPLFRGTNADLNTTLALAIISVVMTQAYAIKELGLFRHLRKYFSWNPMLLFLGLLELLAEVSKMISFSFRLFGNIFAGEVLLAVISFLLPLLGPLPFFGLELFVGALQALIFTMLTLVFLQIATMDHTSGDHHPSHSDNQLLIEQPKLATEI